MVANESEALIKCRPFFKWNSLSGILHSIFCSTAKSFSWAIIKLLCDSYCVVNCYCKNTLLPQTVSAARNNSDEPKNQSATIALDHFSCIKQTVTRSSATTEKQRVSCACIISRLANWSYNAQNTRESQRLRYFWHFWQLWKMLWFKKRWPKNAFWHEIATQGHSRSFILQSFAGRQGIAYRYIRYIAS